MQVAVIKYNAGNVQSVLYALERQGVEAVLTDEIEIIQRADRVIFPGQGEASTAMRYLKERKLDVLIPKLRQPFFGVCLGQQLLCEYSEENDTPCLGVFPVKVKRFIPESHEEFKVPHIGWNNIFDLRHPLLEGLDEQSYVYYVHSFFCEDSEYTIAKTHYVQDFAALMHRDNFYAMQAHPEKSGKVGERILENFLGMSSK